jgi:hypothetical protein
MKKLFLIVAVGTTTMFSCTKEDSCNCGTIANDGIDNGCYWLDVRSECSGNTKRFCFDQDVWLDSHVGEGICLNNEVAW